MLSYHKLETFPLQLATFTDARNVKQVHEVPPGEGPTTEQNSILSYSFTQPSQKVAQLGVQSALGVQFPEYTAS